MSEVARKYDLIAYLNTMTDRTRLEIVKEEDPAKNVGVFRLLKKSRLPKKGHRWIAIEEGTMLESQRIRCDRPTRKEAIEYTLLIFAHARLGYTAGHPTAPRAAEEFCCPTCGLNGDHLKVSNPKKCKGCCKLDAAGDLYDACDAALDFLIETPCPDHVTARANALKDQLHAARAKADGAIE